MNVLVVFGSKLGGTEGIARQVGATLQAGGHTVEVRPARQVRGGLDGFDAVVVGGALYAGRWQRDAQVFVIRHARQLRTRDVWFFSSGPLDGSAARREIPPTSQVQQLMDHVCANGHATFGGRLESTVTSFPAAAMAKTKAGDWRDPARIVAWSLSIGDALKASSSRPRAVRTPKPLPSRNPTLALTAFTGLTATVSGALLVARPDGALLNAPPWLLAHSPFHDFLVPGLLLLAVVGLGNVWAAWLTARRSDFAPFASFAAGCALLGWITVEMIMVRPFSFLQLIYLATALVTIGDAVRRLRALFRDVTAAIPEADATTGSPHPAR